MAHALMRIASVAPDGVPRGPVGVIEEGDPALGRERQRLLAPERIGGDRLERTTVHRHDVLARSERQRRHLADADAGLVGDPLLDHLRERKVEHDGPGRIGQVGKRHGPHHEARVVLRVRAGGRNVVSKQAGKALARDPLGQHHGRVEVGPGAGGSRQGHGQGSRRTGRPGGFNRAGQTAHRDDGQRHERVSRLDAREAALERLEEGSRRRAGLQFRDRRLGQELRLIGQRSQTRLHQIGADVEEQEQACQQKERDHQQAGDDTDEDVGQDQLPAHAPQQAASRPEREAGEAIGAREDEREAAHHVDRIDHRRQTRPVRPPGAR